jgi:hypothetical protein
MFSRTTASLSDDYLKITTMLRINLTEKQKVTKQQVLRKVKAGSQF